ncbi:toxin VapC19, partial [Mycobacterium tuberculosis UT0048]
MKLIDTTIAVDHLRGEPAAAVRESELAALEAFFSAVVWTLVTEDIARIGGRL